MSLSTVYNTLNQFAGAGLLREIAVQGPRTYFHTRTSPHHHFMDESTGRMFDAADEKWRNFLIWRDRNGNGVSDDGELQSLDEAGLSPMARAFYAENRRIANAKAKRVLGWQPRYPTYREGLRACLSAAR